jgi:hypothetical protein
LEGDDPNAMPPFGFPIMNKHIRFAAYTLIVIVALLSSGCASIFNSGNRNIAINSQPSGAQVTVAKTNTGEMLYSGVATPLTVSLPPKAGYFRGQHYTVSFKLAGYQSATVQIVPTISGWYFGNILLGGAIGMVIVDPLTGSMWNLTPDKIQQNLSPAQASLIKSGNGFVVVLASSLTDQERRDMVRVR